MYRDLQRHNQKTKSGPHNVVKKTESKTSIPKILKKYHTSRHTYKHARTHTGGIQLRPTHHAHTPSIRPWYTPTTRQTAPATGSQRREERRSEDTRGGVVLKLWISNMAADHGRAHAHRAHGLLFRELSQMRHRQTERTREEIFNPDRHTDTYG
jgi:hypothetical protein